MRRLLVPLLMVAAGCHKIDDVDTDHTVAENGAPTGLDDLSKYLYAHFDDADPQAMINGMTNMDLYLSAQDMAASKNDRASTLSVLSGEDFGTIVPSTFVAPSDDPGATNDSNNDGVEDNDPSLQEPIAFYGQSAHSFDELRTIQGDPNQVCFAANADQYSGRTFTSDVDCFVAGTCDTLTTTNEIFVNTLIADVWLDVNADFLVVELADGRHAMISRANMPHPNPTLSGGKMWEQRYTLDVWIPSAGDAGPTARYYAMWSSTTAISGSLYTSKVVDGLDEYFTNTDAMVDGEECSNDRDREYDRPE
jgi:hypothetical protein